MQQSSTPSPNLRRSQVVEILATGILRILAGRALERDSRVEVGGPSGRPQPLAWSTRPSAAPASR